MDDVCVVAVSDPALLEPLGLHPDQPSHGTGVLELIPITLYGVDYAILRRFANDYVPQYAVDADGSVSSTASGMSVQLVHQFVLLRLDGPVDGGAPRAGVQAARAEMPDKEFRRSDNPAALVVERLARAVVPTPGFVAEGLRPACSVLGPTGLACERPVAVCWYDDAARATCGFHWPALVRGLEDFAITAAYGEGAWCTAGEHGAAVGSFALLQFAMAAERNGITTVRAGTAADRFSDFVGRHQDVELAAQAWATAVTNPELGSEQVSEHVLAVRRAAGDGTGAPPSPSTLYYLAHRPAPVAGPVPDPPPAPDATSWLEYGDLLYISGRAADACGVYAHVAQTSSDARAATRLAVVASLQEDRPTASAWFEYAASLGDAGAGRSAAAILLDTPGRADEGLQRLHAMATAGDPVAMDLLAGALGERGDVVGAQYWDQRAEATAPGR